MLWMFLIRVCNCSDRYNSDCDPIYSPDECMEVLDGLSSESSEHTDTPLPDLLHAIHHITLHQARQLLQMEDHALPPLCTRSGNRFQSGGCTLGDRIMV